MTRNWAVFWGSMAIITLAGAATTYAGLGRPWDLGSVADWVAGLGAFGAIVVALRTAARAGDVALRVAEDDRLERLDERQREEVRTVKYLIAILCNCHFVISARSGAAKNGEAPPQGVMEIYTKSSGTTAISDALASFPVTSLPSTQLVDFVLRARRNWGVALSELVTATADPTTYKEKLTRRTRTLSEFVDAVSHVAVLHGARPEPFDDEDVRERLEAAMERAGMARAT